MNRFRSLIPFAALLVIALAVIVTLFPTAHPGGGISLPLDKSRVVARADSLLRAFDINGSGIVPSIELRANQSIMQLTQERFGIEEANRLFRDTIPAYQWRVRWTPEQRFSFSWNDDDKEDAPVDSQALLRGAVEMDLSPAGTLLRYERTIDDSIALASVDVREAQALATSFLARHTPYLTFITSPIDSPAATRTELRARTDHRFSWNGHSPLLSTPLTIAVRVSGNSVTLAEAVPTTVEDKFESRAIAYIPLILLYVAVGIGIIVVAIRRIRSYEIGFRMAMIFGIIIGLLADFEIYLSMQSQFRWELLVPLIMTPVFIGGLLVLLWTVTESLVREIWKEKFLSFDLITHGHLFHRHLGEQTIRGFGVGAAAFAIWLILVTIWNWFEPFWMLPPNGDRLHLFTLALPWLYVLSHSLYGSAFVYVFFVLFLLSVLQKYLRREWLVLLLGAVALFIMSVENKAAFPSSMLIYMLSGVIVLWSFYRYDALAPLIALMTWTAASDIGSLLVSGNSAYAQAGWMTIGCFGLLFAVSFVALFRKDAAIDLDSITPAFAHYISERQRLQQELEIARSVQMSFLPKRNPDHQGLDIASRCAPALEVGGDYYDFIDLAENRLGVAVGDVSGKGTQAAFFMTLTKGFLRALANVSGSPSQVLTQVNRLFYESVDRGMFISMVYGIFDMRNHRLTLARAGHNPVIMRKSGASEVQTVNPGGMALGLDPGDAFARSIEQQEISFQSGDLFVFYTDGFPEAMNKKNEEFGEERLAQSVAKHATQSAEEIMSGIYQDVKTFTGTAKQHDDMTIVVVKVGDIEPMSQ